jgi:hypothetical protein
MKKNTTLILLENIFVPTNMRRLMGSNSQEDKLKQKKWLSFLNEVLR